MKIVDVFFSTKIWQGIEEPMSFRSDQSFGWVWDIGNQLRDGLLTSVGGVAHVNGNHWVAFVFDFKNTKLLYGDSLHAGAPAPAHFRAVFEWWATQLGCETPLTSVSLPIGKQFDSRSCGLFAVNALAHYTLPDQSLLLEQPAAMLVHLKHLRDILNVHNLSVVSQAFGCQYHHAF